MRSTKKLVIAALTATFMFSAVGCSMIQKTDAAIQGTVVGTVNGEKITLSQVDKELAGWYSNVEQQFGAEYAENEQVLEAIPQQRGYALEGMITDKVLLTKASQLNLAPAEEDLNKEVDKKFKELQEALGESFDQALVAEGFTEETLKDYLGDQVVAEKAIDYMVKDVTVTDEEIKTYYDENKDQMKNFGEAESRHLLFDTEEEAKAASEKIKNKEVTFDKLFNDYKDNQAKKEAADATEDEKKLPIAQDLGKVAHNQQGYDTDFLAGFMTLKEGEISGPVKSRFGYHIIEAKNVKETTDKSLDDVKEEVKTTLTQEKENEVVTKTLEEWKTDLKVKTYPEKLNKYLKNVNQQ